MRLLWPDGVDADCFDLSGVVGVDGGASVGARRVWGVSDGRIGRRPADDAGGVEEFSVKQKACYFVTRKFDWPACFITHVNAGLLLAYHNLLDDGVHSRKAQARNSVL